MGMGWRGRRLDVTGTLSRQKKGFFSMDMLGNGQDNAHAGAAADEHHDQENENDHDSEKRPEVWFHG